MDIEKEDVAQMSMRQPSKMCKSQISTGCPKVSNNGHILPTGGKLLCNKTTFKRHSFKHKNNNIHWITGSWLGTGT